MIQVINNSGILMDDYLDSLRSSAILQVCNTEGLPSEVINYITALERVYLSMRMREHEKMLDTVQFKLKIET